MVWRTWSIICAGLVLVATAAAQERPSFGGTWKADRALATYTGRGNRPDSDLQIGPVPETLVITQDDKTLTVEQRFSAMPTNSVTYTLDGRSGATHIRVNHPILAAPAAVTSQWKGDRLVSRFTVSVPGEAAPRLYEQAIWLNPEGSLFVQDQRPGSPDVRIVGYRKVAVSPAVARAR